jgi:hypothetical protein
MPIIRRSDCVPLPIVVCPVVAVVMLERRVARFSTHLATCLSSITTGTTGQTTIGSGMQSDLLMMVIRMPETC